MQFIGDIADPTVIEIVGLLTLFYLFVYRPSKFVLYWLLNNCSSASKRVLKPGANDYAVITGATDGIGLEYATQLAERGYNLVLLSRTEDKLKRVANEIKNKYQQLKIEILAVDLSKTDIYDRIRERLQSLDGQIRVLVNNVGMGHPVPEYFANLPEGLNMALINTNIVSTTVMSEIVIKLMLQQQNFDVNHNRINSVKGVVINISSALGSSEYPLFSSYSASKAYTNYLSKILAIEYENDNIIVQTVTPNQVDTKLSKDLSNSLMSVPVDDFVRHALNSVGAEQETNGHPRHKLINNLTLWIGWLIGDRLFMKMKLNAGKSFRKEFDQRV